MMLTYGCAYGLLNAIAGQFGSIMKLMPKCHCGLDAVLQIQDGPFLCVRCYGTLQATQQEAQRNAFAFMNYLQDEMAFMVGMAPIGPRIEIPPRPAYIGNTTVNTTNNIRVEQGSQVGQINAGALVYLNKAVTAFNTAGLSDMASALREFTQQVVDSHELNTDNQKQILDSLRFLTEELPKKDQNSSMFKLALQNIGTLVSGISAISQHWDKLKAVVDHLIT